MQVKGNSKKNDTDYKFGASLHTNQAQVLNEKIKTLALFGTIVLDGEGDEGLCSTKLWKSYFSVIFNQTQEMEELLLKLNRCVYEIIK